jgi:hypothetical protein
MALNSWEYKKTIKNYKQIIIFMLSSTLDPLDKRAKQLCQNTLVTIAVDELCLLLEKVESWYTFQT